MKAIKLSDILRPFEGKWVAINKCNKVIASGDNPEQVLILAQRKDPARPLITLVPSLDLDYVG